MQNQQIINSQNQFFQTETEKFKMKDETMNSFDENKNELTFNAEITNNQLKNSFGKI